VTFRHGKPPDIDILRREIRKVFVAKGGRGLAQRQRSFAIVTGAA
jgi:hypothetical protein